MQPATNLSDEELAAIARELQIIVPALKAIMDVPEFHQLPDPTPKAQRNMDSYLMEAVGRAMLRDANALFQQRRGERQDFTHALGQQDLDEMDQIDAIESYGEAGFAMGVPGGKASLDFSLNITPANYGGLNPGAGWSGFSFTNEGGIATIDSSGKISWSGWGGLTIEDAQSQFASNADLAAALATLGGKIAGLFGLGREDSPPGAPPDPPQDSTPPDPGGPY